MTGSSKASKMGDGVYGSGSGEGWAVKKLVGIIDMKRCGRSLQSVDFAPLYYGCVTVGREN